ncbi:MAG TPA: hypothetical protein PLU87_14520 [Sedimentisphaerales bacterium]|nr:hypothetical protein [Sedimentisphaerales bacterium]HRS12956.1 hypothetical protein [Sedimentisphaerales bacterium]HRV49547.1 hypothetical protein [Sedimentisphaerales bacterium]
MRILKMNNLMSKIYAPDSSLKDIELPESLKDVIKAGVVFCDGCYLLRSAFDKNTHIRLDQCQDRTAYESLLNHIHIEDHGDDRLPVAFALLSELSRLLKREYPGVEFLGEISSEPNGHECVARFYSKHKGEPPRLVDDLEGYELNAVCLLDLSS